MNRRVARVFLSALTALVTAASLTFATTSPASAIGRVTCSPNSDFVDAYGHDAGADNNDNHDYCWANAGTDEWGGGQYFLGWMIQLDRQQRRPVARRRQVAAGLADR